MKFIKGTTVTLFCLIDFDSSETYYCIYLDTVLYFKSKSTPDDVWYAVLDFVVIWQIFGCWKSQTSFLRFFKAQRKKSKFPLRSDFFYGHALSSNVAWTYHTDVQYYGSLMSTKTWTVKLLVMRWWDTVQLLFLTSGQAQRRLFLLVSKGNGLVRISSWKDQLKDATDS